MKKRIIKLLTSIIGITCLASCGKNQNFDSITDIKKFDGIDYTTNNYFNFDSNCLNIEVGASKQIVISSIPESYVGQQIVYKSLDESVATVSETGAVTAVGKGITDIIVSSKDEKVKSLVRISSYEKSSKDGIQSTINAIKDEIGEKRKSFTCIEASSDYYYSDGVIQYGSESLEKFVYDAEEGYLLLEAAGKDILTAGGAPETYHVKYIFYTLNYGSMTRFIGMRSTGNKYIDINTSEYDTNEEIILAACNMFFSMGEDVVNNMLDDINGFKDNQQIIEESKTVGLMGDKQLFAYYYESGDDTVSIEDEIEYFDIPAYSTYSYTYDMELVFDGPFCQSLATKMSMKYHDFRDDKDWERKFNRSKIYDSEVEFETYDNPSEKGFTEAESVYDI